MSDLVIGNDGRARCPWASTPEYVQYHDSEWGRPLHGDDAMFDTLPWRVSKPDYHGSRFCESARVSGLPLRDFTSTTSEAQAMASALKQRGFRFIGPTTAYALMQATGMVDGHLRGCHVSI